MGDIHEVALKDLQATLFSDKKVTTQYVPRGKFM